MEKENNISNILLIIGNGFDLDLGLKTGYSDFLKSEFFTKNLDIMYDQNNINLFNYLENQKNIKGWIDVEKELADLASREPDFHNRYINKTDGKLAVCSDREVQTFQQLRLALHNYLDNISYDIRKDSLALRVLDIVNSSFVSANIVTFNYTPLQKLTPFLRENKIAVPISYIHGSLRDNDILNDDTSIILGFQDDIEIDDSYCFMIKSHSPYYTSKHIKRKLLEADEVIFFGHSLGSTDYPYFADFFKEQCAEKSDEQIKKVRIFTWDEKSRQNILVQLRNMNEKRTQMLYEYCDFDIYRTGDINDYPKIQGYLDNLQSRINFETI